MSCFPLGAAIPGTISDTHVYVRAPALLGPLIITWLGQSLRFVRIAAVTLLGVFRRTVAIPCDSLHARHRRPDRRRARGGGGGGGHAVGLGPGARWFCRRGGQLAACGRRFGGRLQLLLAALDLEDHESPPHENGSGPDRHVGDEPGNQSAQAGGGDRVRRQRQIAAEHEAEQTSPALGTCHGSRRAWMRGDARPAGGRVVLGVAVLTLLALL